MMVWLFYEVKQRMSWFVPGWVTLYGWPLLNLAENQIARLHIYLLNVVNRISFFLSSANLICRTTDTSKYFREYLGIRDNESQL